MDVVHIIKVQGQQGQTLMSLMALMYLMRAKEGATSEKQANRSKSY
jgi:hypothetical protein